MDEKQKRMKLVDEIHPKLMELSDLLISENPKGSMTINVNGGSFVFINDYGKPEKFDNSDYTFFSEFLTGVVNTFGDLRLKNFFKKIFEIIDYYSQL